MLALGMVGLAALGYAVITEPPGAVSPLPPAAARPADGEHGPRGFDPSSPLTLKGAGTTWTLPEGFRLRPDSLRADAARTTARAEGAGILISAAFYNEAGARMRQDFQALAEGRGDAALRALLLGDGTPLTHGTTEVGAGVVLRFDSHGETRDDRRTLLVALPPGQDRLVTAALRWRFSSARARKILRLVEAFAFD